VITSQTTLKTPQSQNKPQQFSEGCKTNPNATNWAIERVNTEGTNTKATLLSD